MSLKIKLSKINSKLESASPETPEERDPIFSQSEVKNHVWGIFVSGIDTSLGDRAVSQMSLTTEPTK